MEDAQNSIPSTYKKANQKLEGSKGVDSELKSSWKEAEAIHTTLDVMQSCSHSYYLGYDVLVILYGLQSNHGSLCV